MDDCCAASCHSPSPDPAYRRILWIALALNVAMFFVEVVASLSAHSVSLQADALDFLGDAGNYAVSLFVLGRAGEWRARTAFGKGVVMGTFGASVAVNTLWHAISGEVPQAEVMSGVGLLALAVNVGVAVLLYRHRAGDSNRLSVWLCSRNDAIANVAVILAGVAVSITGTRWPDVVVAAVIAGLGLTGAWHVIGNARAELREHAHVAR